MPKDPDNKTKPEDKVPLLEKLFYGAGSGSYQLSGDGVKGLANPIYNLTLGLSPSLIGLVLMISRIFDAFTDPLVGKLSDDTRSRWGRRRPYIFVGSFLAAIGFVVIWMVPESWAGQTQPLFIYYLVAMLVFYLFATIQVVPYHTLGLEMTADYNERTAVAAYKMTFSFAFTLLLPWIFRFAQSDVFGGSVMAGMRYWSYILAAIIVIGGVLPAIFVKERYYHIAKKQAKISFWKGMKLTFQNSSFRAFTLLNITKGLGFGLVGAFGPYIIYFHIYGGDTKVGQELQAICANVGSITALICTLFVAKVTRHFGKIQVVRTTIIVSIITALLTFVCYSKGYPYLVVIIFFMNAPVNAAYWTVLTSMKADICDEDELKNGMRREGMFGAVGNWIGKITLSLTFLLAGLLLEATGFRAELKGNQAPETLFWMRFLFAVVPVFFSAGALYFLSRYRLTAERMAEIRLALENRRGK